MRCPAFWKHRCCGCPSHPPRSPRPAQVPDASTPRTTGPCWAGKGARPRRRDGRSPSRRPGGPAPERWQRRPRRPPVTTQDSPATSTASTAVIGGQRENIRRLAARTFGQVKAGELPDRARCRSGGSPGGSKGGGSTPRQSANVLHRVCWLPTRNSRKPALGGAAETASQSTVRSSVHRAVAGKLRGLSIADLKDGEGDGRPRHLPGDSGALCRPPFSPYPYPSGTGDRRSGAIPAPVDYPKWLRSAPKRPLIPAARSDQVSVPALRAAR